MLTNAIKPTYRSSISKPSEVSAGSCSPSENELPAPEELPQGSTANDLSAEIEAAQKLIAEIAVRIMTAKRRQTNG